MLHRRWQRKCLFLLSKVAGTASGSCFYNGPWDRCKPCKTLSLKLSAPWSYDCIVYVVGYFELALTFSHIVRSFSDLKLSDWRLHRHTLVWFGSARDCPEVSLKISSGFHTNRCLELWPLAWQHTLKKKQLSRFCAWKLFIKMFFLSIIR